MIQSYHIKFFNTGGIIMPLILLQGELLSMQADAVVNPADRHLRRGSGICADIFDRAGEQLHAACRRIGHCAVGDAVITPGFELDARFIIHTVAPQWIGGKISEREKLRACYMRSLDLALSHDLHSVAVPLLTARRPFSKREAMRTAVSAIGDWLMDNESDMEVYLLLHDAEAQELRRQPDSRLQTYIDNQYIDRELLAEFMPPRALGQTTEPSQPIAIDPANGSIFSENVPASDRPDETEQIQAKIEASLEHISKILDDASNAAVSEDDSFELWEIDTAAHPPYYYDTAEAQECSEESEIKSDAPTEDTLFNFKPFPPQKACSQPDAPDPSARWKDADGCASSIGGWSEDTFDAAPLCDSDAEFDFCASSECFEEASAEAGCGEIISLRHEPSQRRLEDLLEQISESFSEMLLRLIDQCGMSDPEVYKRANMDRRLFSKIRSNPGYQPAKSTVLALAIALQLNLDQTTDLLSRAGFAFSPSSKADLIIKYFIREGIFNIHEINEALFSYKQKLLGA